MRLFTDIGIARDTAEGLRALGFDVLEVRQTGQPSMTDAAIMARARAESRVVVTCDLDFGDLLAASGDHLPSVILLRQRDQTPQGTLPRLGQVLSDRRSELLSGAIVSIEDSGHRLRTLPIKPEGS